MTMLCTVKQCEKSINASRGTVMRLARKFGCIRRIGSRNIRIDIEKLLKCMEQEN